MAQNSSIQWTTHYKSMDKSITSLYTSVPYAGTVESCHYQYTSPWTFSRAEVHLKGFTLPWKNPDISLKKNIHERNMTLGSKFQCSGHFFSSPMLRLNVGLFGISGAGFQWLQDATSWFINGSEVIPSLKLTFFYIAKEGGFCIQNGFPKFVSKPVDKKSQKYDMWKHAYWLWLN